MLMLNKLNADNFSILINEFRSSFDMTSTDAIQDFVQGIWTFGTSYRRYAKLYALFFQRTYKLLRMTNVREAALRYLRALSIKRNLHTPEDYLFTGLLTEYELLPSASTYKIAVALLNQNDLEFLFNLVLPCPQKIEHENPNFFATFRIMANNDKLDFRLRCLAAELLIMKGSNWKHQTHLIPESMTRGSIACLYEKPVDEVPLPETFNLSGLYSYLIYMITIPYAQFIAKMDQFIDAVKRSNLGTSLANTIRKVSLLEEQPKHYSKIRLGHIIGELILQKILHPTMFGSSIPFDNHLLSGLLKWAELKDDLYNMVSESFYFKNMKFVPKPRVHFLILSALDTTECIDIWPEYQATQVLFKSLNAGDQIQEVLDKLSDFEVGQDFAEFIGELIVLQQPKKYDDVLKPYLKKYEKEVFSHIEWMDIEEEMKSRAKEQLTVMLHE